MTTQLITPDPNIACTPGMCLQYVREAFSLPAHYASATEAWDNSSSQHRDQNFPAGVWLPVWFSLEAIPAGHVALRAPDGSVYSSSDNSRAPHHHPTLDDLLNYYAYYNLPLTYLGWTEDVAGTPVVSVDSSINFDGIPASVTDPAAPMEDALSAAEVVQLQTMINEAANTVMAENTAQITAAKNELKTWVIDQITAAKETTILDARAQIAAVPSAVANFNYRPGANIAGALDSLAAKSAIVDPQAIADAFVNHVGIQITQK